MGTKKKSNFEFIEAQNSKNINSPDEDINFYSQITKYILSIVLVIAVSFYIISYYYDGGLHKEGGSYGVYMLYIGIVYILCKIIKSYLSKEKVVFSPAGIIGYTMINLIILCGRFFSETGGTNGTIVLFFKIIGFLFLPFVISLISYSFGNRILKLIPSFKNEGIPFKFLFSLGLGFTSFITILTIVATIGQYNLYSIALILLIFVGVSFKEIYESLTSLFTFKIEFDNHKVNGTANELINLNLLSAEFSFIILSFLIGVNFINIVRPMPIGWDDLGVYMNFPQIMANSGTILKGAGMIAWQLFTGIGFMFHSATQAFFMNQVGGILSIIVLITVFSDLLNNGSKRHLSIPILLATMFYSMPMVIFEQAKDMKLDPGLFFMSVTGLYLVYKLFIRYLGYEDSKKTIQPTQELDFNINNPETFFSKISSVYKSNNGESKIFDNKDYLIYLVLIGAIIGMAFAIKFTTLMLILGIIGVIFYSKLGFSGFLGYFSFFIAIFTKLKLWDMMNVNYPKDDVNWINSVFYVCSFVGIILLSYSFIKYKQESFVKALILIGVFSLGVLLPLMPWLAKNISETKTSKISVGTLLNGEGGIFIADYSKIYSKNELQTIEDKSKVDAISTSGKASNEDLGRYFGYENGINNYLKLPWNLTMQSNQRGEYTEITYFFLALIPVVLLFLAFKNYIYSIGIVIAIIGGFLYFTGSSIGKNLTDFFSGILLPNGYIYILGIFLVPLIYFLYSLKNDKLSQIFKINMVFFTMYTFIFVIAAYGIVWYGIIMYFSMLLIIGIGLAYLSENSKNETEDILRIFGSLIALIIINIYFFKSSIPHGIDNVYKTGFAEFKGGLVNQEEGIFGSHPDYFTVLSNVNINSQENLSKKIIGSISDTTFKKIVIENIGESPKLNTLVSLFKEIQSTDLSKFISNAMLQQSIKLEAREKQNEVYKNVLYPTKEFQNNDKIYRIGTFLTYFISNNRERYYDDSLIQNFDKYFYDNDADKTVERMKKIGIKFFLTDLNAATIDKDPRHDLTRRYENLLKTFKSDKLELIQTDSLCLQLAIEEKSDNYMAIAGVNYESYTSSGQVISRGQKQLECYNHILGLMKENKITDTNYSYLKPIANYFIKNNISDQSQALNAFQQYVSHGWLALFRIK